MPLSSVKTLHYDIIWLNMDTGRYMKFCYASFLLLFVRLPWTPWSGWNVPAYNLDKLQQPLYISIIDQWNNTFRCETKPLKSTKYRKYLYRFMLQCFNSLRPSDAIWRHRSGSRLAQAMACCLTAPSHYLNQCWLIISKVYLHSSDGNFIRDT